MDIWIDRTEFERIELDESDTVRIEGGFDSFERVDIRESDEDKLDVHIFKIEKETDIFEISMRWAVNPEDDDLSEDDLKEISKNKIRTESNYQASHFLKSMDLPPLQGLFADQMIVEMVPEPDNSDES